MSFLPPLRCPWRCHEIGGPWISYNPACPFHGYDPIPEDPDGGYDIDPEQGERLCRTERDRQDARVERSGTEDETP